VRVCERQDILSSYTPKTWFVVLSDSNRSLTNKSHALITSRSRRTGDSSEKLHCWVLRNIILQNYSQLFYYFEKIAINVNNTKNMKSSVYMSGTRRQKCSSCSENKANRRATRFMSNATVNSRSRIPGNSRESATSKIPGGNFRELLSFRREFLKFPIFTARSYA